MYSFCICDDEKDILEKTKKLLENYNLEKGILSTIHTYQDSSKLADDLSLGIHYQFYFLDILMPLTSGLTIAEMIRSNDPNAHIIFLTSSPEFALESYEYHADHYLLKPIQKEKIYHILDLLFSNTPNNKGCLLTLSFKNNTRTISFDSICYLESRRNKVLFSMNNLDTFEVYYTFTEIEQKLTTHSEFVRIHRSFIINMNYICEVSPGKIVLSTGQQFTLSASYADSFKSAYFSYVENLAHF